jgi:hypothetical protein
MQYFYIKISKKKIFEIILTIYKKENKMNLAYWNKFQKKFKDCKNKFSNIKILKKKLKKIPIFELINNYNNAIYYVYMIEFYIF